MKTSRKSKQDPTVNRAELAKLMSVSLPTIDDWQRRGCPVAHEGGKGRSYAFRVAEVITWRLEDERRRKGLPSGTVATLPEGPAYNPLRVLAADGVQSFLEMAYSKPMVDMMIEDTQKKAGCGRPAAILLVLTIFQTQWYVFAEWVSQDRFSKELGEGLDAMVLKIKPGIQFVHGSLPDAKFEDAEMFPATIHELAHELAGRKAQVEG